MKPEEVQLDSGFEALLAQHQQAYAESEVFDDFNPPDGEHIVRIVKGRYGPKSEDGPKPGTATWVVLSAQIDDTANPEIHEKVTALFFTSKYFGGMKQAAEVLSGKACASNPIAAAKIILASIGYELQILVET